MSSVILPDVGSTYRGILKGTGIYAVAMVFTKMASFIMLPLYTRYLSPAEYGVLELLSLTSFVVSALVFMRIGDSLFYYYSKAESPRGRQEAVCTVFLTAISLGVGCAAAGWFTAGWLSEVVFQTARYTGCMRLVLLTLLFSFPVELGFSYLRLLNRTGLFVAASVANLLLAIFFNLVFLVMFHWGMYAMLWSSLLTAAATAVPMIVASLRGIDLRRRFSLTLMRHFISYSLPLGGSGLGMFVLNFGDRFFLQRAVSLTEVGIYALAYKLGMLIGYVQSPFETYWRSQIFEIMKRPDGERVYIRMATYVAAVLCFMTLLFAAFSKPALAVLVSPDYRIAAAYVPWVAAAYVIRAVTSQFRCVFVLEAHTGNELLVAFIGGGVCLGGYALLIPKYHLWGAVWSTLLGFSIMLLLALFRAQKIRPFAFEYRRLFLIGATTVGLSAPAYLIHPASWWYQVLLGCLLAASYPIILKLSGYFEPEWSLVRRQILGLRMRSFKAATAIAAGSIE